MKRYQVTIDGEAMGVMSATSMLEAIVLAFEAFRFELEGDDRIDDLRIILI